MAHRPTLAEVAKAAEVSLATVDRVLNGRESVRGETRAKVALALTRLGHPGALRLGHAPSRSDLPELRLGVVLHKERQSFYQNFAQELTLAAAQAHSARVTLRMAFSSSQSPAEFADLMRDLGRDCHVIAATAVAHHQVTDCVIDLRQRGIPCFALLNDFAQGERQAYIGLNNVKVGRIAASMIHTAVHRPGKLAVFVGGHRWHGHELRETGFRSYLREQSQGFQVLDTLVNLETRQLTYEATLDLLARHNDLRGIYVAGGGMEGAIAALREVRAPGEVVLVVNEITPESRAALLDRYVQMAICTPLPVLCRDLIARAIQTLDPAMPADPTQHFLRPDLILPELL